MNMRELLQAFYALYIYYKTEEATKEVFGALKSPGLRGYEKEIPSLTDTLAAAFRGNMDYAALGKDLRVFAASYARDPRSKTTTVDLLKAFATWFSSASESAAKKIERYSASALFERWIPAALTQELGSQKDSQLQLRKVMKQMTGEAALGFSDIEIAKQAKERFPELYAEYLRLRREFNSVWKTALSNFVRDSGQHTVSYVKLMKYFQANSIEHSMPLGFTGLIDANGSWYSPFNEELVGVPSAAIFPSVKMNPSYVEGSSEYVLQALKHGGVPGNYFYTKNASRKATREKFSNVQDFIPVVDKIRAKWVTLVKAFDPDDRRTVAAVVLELLFQFSARIGTVGNSTFGLATVLVKHYTPQDNGFVLRYLGKDGVATKHVYRGTDILSKRIIAIMAQLVEGKSPRDPIFTYTQKNGLFRIVQPAVVNGLFKALGAGNLTVHKLRTYHATRIFREQVDIVYGKRAKFASTKDALEVLKKIAVMVGKQLNHVRRAADGSQKITPATALSAYIDVGDQVKFFQHYGLPLPKYLENFAVEARVRKITAAAVPSNVDDMPPAYYDTYKNRYKTEGDESEAEAFDRENIDEVRVLSTIAARGSRNTAGIDMDKLRMTLAEHKLNAESDEETTPPEEQSEEEEAPPPKKEEKPAPKKEEQEEEPSEEEDDELGLGDQGEAPDEDGAPPKLKKDVDELEEEKREKEYQEELAQQEEEEDKLRDALAEQVNKIIMPLTKGGTTAQTNTGDEISRFQNVLLGDDTARPA